MLQGIVFGLLEALRCQLRLVVAGCALLLVDALTHLKRCTASTWWFQVDLDIVLGILRPHCARKLGGRIDVFLAESIEVILLLLLLLERIDFEQVIAWEREV